MGLFDGVGGTMGGTMPLGTMTPMGVATSLGAAASAVGLPGFSMVPAPFYLLAGMGWSSGSSYWGHPEFRGVADMAKGSNALQEGWSLGSALGGGLGMLGMGAPAVGSGGYYIGPYPSFNPMAMFSWMYQQTFGEPQQAAGPAQAAAPQPAPSQVEGKGNDQEEPKKAAPRRTGSRSRPRLTAAVATSAAIIARKRQRLAVLEANNRIMSLSAADQAELAQLRRDPDLLPY